MCCLRRWFDEAVEAGAFVTTLWVLLVVLPTIWLVAEVVVSDPEEK